MGVFLGVEILLFCGYLVCAQVSSRIEQEGQRLKQYEEERRQRAIEAQKQKERLDEFAKSQLIKPTKSKKQPAWTRPKKREPDSFRRQMAGPAKRRPKPPKPEKKESTTSEV